MYGTGRFNQMGTTATCLGESDRSVVGRYLFKCENFQGN